MPRPHILVCDDESGIRESLRLILEPDYLLTYASHGRDALEYVRRHDPDLLIMDIKMPHLNGLDALREIKQIKPHQRVLIITGYESSDVAAEVLQAGANDYLTKPFEREAVREKVETLLSSSV